MKRSSLLILLAGIIIVVLGLIIIGLLLPNFIDTSVSSYPGCSYHLAYVAFDDADEDGIRDMDEAGVEGVTVQLSINGEISHEAQTNAEGVAILEAYDVLMCQQGQATLLLMVGDQQYGAYSTTTYPQEPPFNVIYAAQG
jgi:hypothetical protein